MVVSCPSDENAMSMTGLDCRRVFANVPTAPLANRRTAADASATSAPGGVAGVSCSDAAPTTSASPTSSRARSYRWVACSMTWPPPSTPRRHHAGGGVESFQRAVTSRAGLAASRARTSGSRSSERRWYPTATTSPRSAIAAATRAGPAASVAASGFSARNGIPRATTASQAAMAADGGTAT